jgi:hypothetical protein
MAEERQLKVLRERTKKDDERMKKLYEETRKELDRLSEERNTKKGGR